MEELKERIHLITDPYKEKKVVYEAMTILGIPYKKTTCKRCIMDYYNIVREELGLIEDAAEVSPFNEVEEEGHEYIYLKRKPVAWNGHIMNQNTDANIIKAFLNTGATGYYLINRNKF